MTSKEDGSVHYFVDADAARSEAEHTPADAADAGMTEEQYYSALMRTIEFAGEDPARLRRMIYDLARNELRRQLYHRLDFRFLEIKQQTSALERAIENVESQIGEQLVSLPSYRQAPTSEPQDPGPFDLDAAAELEDPSNKANHPVAVRQPQFANQPLIWPEKRTGGRIYEGYAAPGGHFAPYQKPKPIRSAFWSTFQLFIAVLLGAAVISVMENRGALFSHASNSSAADDLAARSQQLVSAEEPGTHSHSSSDITQAQSNSTSDSDSNSIGLPMPRSYGVYAIDQGKLVNLPTFPIRVPDPKVRISAIFPMPGTTTFPDGKLQFIAFRRDLMDQAPDHVTIRVVARVARALTFDKSGAARTVPIDSSWAVRSKSYEMKVSPVDGKPEMILIQPETDGFTLPPGRYALVVSKTAYDFTVAGKVTDPAQCLERTDAVNMPVYTECGPADPTTTGAAAE